MKGALFGLSLLGILWVSCSTFKQGSNSDNPSGDSKMVISYQLTDSLNQNLPEYTLELYSNRQMFLYAKKNLDKSGKYMRSLSKPEFEQLIETFANSGFLKFETEYCHEGHQQARILYFSYQNESKRIKICSHAPESLNELEFSMQSFLDRVGWEKLTW